MSTTQLAFLISGLAGFATVLGCIPLFFSKQKNSFLIMALSFAAGVVICVSLTDLLPSAIQLFGKTNPLFPSFILCGIFLSIGVLLSIFIDKYLPSDQPTIQNTSGKHLYRIGLISCIAIILHNIPEGIATFMTTSTNVRLGISFAIAITLHNIPEGISISVPIYYATGSKLRAFFYALLSGMSEPFGAILAYLFLSPFINDSLMASLYAIIAGIMIQISSYELLPTAWSYQKKKLCTISFVAGAIVMLLSHFIF